MKKNLYRSYHVRETSFLWISNYLSVHSKCLPVKLLFLKTLEKEVIVNPASLNSNKDDNNNNKN